MLVEESAEKIYGYLSDGLSENAVQRRRAETALRDAEEQQDFFASLAMITVASDEDAAPQVRWLAAVCAKNAVSRSWRRRVHGNAVTEEERTYVRGLLLSAMGEKHSTIATQISVWIARIARIDFPRSWPSLVSDLCDMIRGSNEEVMFHALVTLDMVVEELSSKRLLSDRKRFWQVSPKIFAVLHDHFVTHLQVLVLNQGPPDVVKRSFQVVEKCMRCFKKLVEFGCESITDFQPLPSVFAKFTELPDVFMRGAAGGTEVQLRLSYLASKLVAAAQGRSPIHFQEFLPKFLEIYYNTVVSFNFGVSDDRTCFQAALFLKHVLSCPTYDINVASINQFKEGRAAGARPPEGVSADGCRYIVLSCFDESRVNVLIEAMISKIFVLSERELETWATDPETLVREEDAADWGTESLRHECEEIFKIVLIREKPRVVPMILRLTESVPADKPLLLDACYRAVGRVVEDLQGAFDFETWLNGQLGSILGANCSTNLGERIIQARTAWLVGQFVDQLTRESRQVVSPLLVRLMSFTEGDLVIALTATKAMQHLVEDLGFHSGDFAPHLETCVLNCFRLVCIAETYATKRDVLGVVVSLIRRSQAQYVIPLLEPIAKALPELWQGGRSPSYSGSDDTHPAILNDSDANGLGIDMGSGGENLLRVAITEVLTAVIQKTGPVSLQSQTLRKIAFEVTTYAVDLKKGMGGTFMMEDGCELWATIIAASTEYSEDLAMLFPRTEGILGIDFDYLKEVFQLIEGYALLGKEHFMNQYGPRMLQTLQRALGSVKDRGCLAALEILDTILQLFPGQGVEFLSQILKDSLDKIVSREESQIMTAAYAGIIARACLVNVGDVERLVLRGNEFAAVELVDAMLKNLDSMYKLRRRKLVVLAVCGLATRYSSSANVLQRIPLVLNAVVQVLAEERHRKERNEREDHPNDFLNAVARFGEEGNTNEESFLPDQEKLPEGKRRDELHANDIVEQLDLRDVCTNLLVSLKSDGEEKYQAILHSTDPTVLQQLGALVQK